MDERDYRKIERERRRSSLAKAKERRKSKAGEYGKATEAHAQRGGDGDTRERRTHGEREGGTETRTYDQREKRWGGPRGDRTASGLRPAVQSQRIERCGEEMQHREAVCLPPQRGSMSLIPQAYRASENLRRGKRTRPV